MERTKLKQTADAILTADWHLREDPPICRTDIDFLNTQIKKMQFIRNLQAKHNCIVIHAGDLFHHWKPSPFLLTQAFRWLPEEFYTVYGNHDLPQHNKALAEKTGLNTLISAGRIKQLKGADWGVTLNDDLTQYMFEIGGRKILVWHILTWKDNTPWPGCQDPIAKELLKKLPQFDLIVTGHLHTSFVETLQGRVLVNPGPITRQTADQEFFEPKVFLWYAKYNSVEAVSIPIKKGVVTREHIENSEERDSRIRAFVERLNSEWEVGLSFEANLERFRKENNVRSSVMKIVLAAIDKEM